MNDRLMLIDLRENWCGDRDGDTDSQCAPPLHYTGYLVQTVCEYKTMEYNLLRLERLNTSRIPRSTVWKGHYRPFQDKLKVFGATDGSLARRWAPGARPA